MQKAVKYGSVMLALALGACSSSPGGKPAGGTGGEEPETGGTGGAAGAGGAVMPTSNGGMTGTGGATADASAPVVADADSPVGAPRDAGADLAMPAAGGFTCNQLVGPSPMMQWFDGGFLQHPGIDAKKWQMFWVAHHYTDAWAKPGDPAWNTALDKGHACAQGSMAPDRVIFQATHWSHTTRAQWETDLAGIVENIKKKWPGVKRIELMASTSAPGNVPCPGTKTDGNETIIAPFAYEAIEAMPAKYPGLVFALPHFEVPCKDFIGNGSAPQYAPSATATTGPAVMDVAALFGAYWAAHP